MSQLVLRLKAVRGKKSLDFEPVKIADGVIATSTLVEKEGKVIIISRAVRASDLTCLNLFFTL